MNDALRQRIAQLSDIQREAVRWQDGAALVLAGPGAGKTGVLTARIARLLEDSQPRRFKVLALTFTTKAAKEMGDRVAALIPDLTERAFIGTFHAFCATLVRQHGSHIGIRPDFGIYDQDSDRLALLEEALDGAGLDASTSENLLSTIDRLKQNLIVPDKAAARFSDQDLGERIAKGFAVYEAVMRAENLMDFHGLILEACRLVMTVPAVAERLRQTYPYWLIDEFQDTSPAQLRFLKGWAGNDFKNIFAVADDDQIIYQWAGAGYRQLERFREHFHPTQIQLVENHRCPASIVAAANRLVAHNTQRTPNKSPLVATRADGAKPITVARYPTDAEESQGVADLLAQQDPATLPQTAVIARGSAQLQAVQECLRKASIKSDLAERRGRFASPQFAWLHASLELAIRSTDRRLFQVFGDAAERLVGTWLPTATILDEAQAANVGFLECWAKRAGTTDHALAKSMSDFAMGLVNERGKWRKQMTTMIPALIVAAKIDGNIPVDVEEDEAAWKAAEAEIKRELGSDPDLPEFVQSLALRSKSPPAQPGAVSLLTVHASKGLEFEHVYAIGLAESVFPTYQSVKKGDLSAEMEEERRNCFVAVTRTKQTLVISFAERYRGYVKQPSRFLSEMDLLGEQR